MRGEVIADLRPNRQGHGLGCARAKAANPVLRVARCLELCAKAWRGKTDGIWVIYPIYPLRVSTNTAPDNYMYFRPIPFIQDVSEKATIGMM